MFFNEGHQYDAMIHGDLSPKTLRAMSKVELKKYKIRQFLAVKEMYLSIQFDCREHSEHSLDELGLKKGGNDHSEGLSFWGLYYGEFDGIGSDRSFSRLLGKRLFAPLPKTKSGMWGFAE